MHTVQIINSSDDLSGVQIVASERSVPSPEQLSVRMVKAAVHPSDLNYIRGDYRAGLEKLLWNYQESQPTFDAARQQPHPTMPCIPGGEGVGIVESCGSAVDSAQWLGKRVAVTAGPPNGTWQQYLNVLPQQAVALPDALPDEQAALMMINPLTALAMTRYILKAQPGEWLLMSAGASAVSKMVAALGRHYGFKTISIVRNRASADGNAGQLGDEVVISEEQDLARRVKEITAGRGVAMALDCVGGSTAEALIGCLTERGRALLYGTLDAPSFNLFSRNLMMTNATLSGFYLPGWLAAQSLQARNEALAELAKLSATGLLFSQVDAQYPLDQAVAAVKASTARGRTGKILLDFTG